MVYTKSLNHIYSSHTIITSLYSPFLLTLVTIAQFPAYNIFSPWTFVSLYPVPSIICILPSLYLFASLFKTYLTFPFVHLIHHSMYILLKGLYKKSGSYFIKVILLKCCSRLNYSIILKRYWALCLPW